MNHSICAAAVIAIGLLATASLQAADKDTQLYEMRVYYSPAGKLDNLHARFRDHVVKLFEKHGMTNVAYWTLASDQKDADKMLIYFLAHKSPEAAKESFGNFGKDADWVAARKESEEKAGGPLTEKDGVKSVYLKPTDY